ncbi:response regulator [Actinoplanes regularis]|uniref:Response regulator receiver domain-containing protein n=1 Tax=Actinoplanes regularis TaxID=52697 RepID=A0A239FT13_9ACTN|nr:response regulator [Actinoplanes regularis]GIE90186.1 response regulator [Actinoplanes regularis]SNS59024.1 Response regulator receiver domain-containing protein [Actinoplanes regularis]
MTVLVLAEDDDDIRKLSARILRRAGYTVIEAVDGGTALEAVREHNPAVVVSDVDMPVMTGVELSLALRADPATRDLPVIFVSGSLIPGDARPTEGQATDVLLKPFLPADLLACVEKVLETGHIDGTGPDTAP